MGCRPDRVKTVKRGTELRPGFKDKWWCKAEVGQRRDSGSEGMGKTKEHCWHWIVFVAETRISVPEEVKTKCARVITLGEICPMLSGTRLDLCKKVKKTTKKRAHIAVYKGKLSHASCKMEEVIADLRETTWPKKCLTPRNKCWKW